MHSHMRSKEVKDIAAKALEYCPLDLYSGDPERVKKALHGLWEVWVGTSGATNNLRVFVDGHILRPNATVSARTSLRFIFADRVPCSLPL
jgi:inositol-pentakisphosphate 2-kinase